MRKKVVFVTGAASGIGRGIAEGFAREGHSVVLSDINKEGLSKIADSYKEQGWPVLDITCDVTQEGQVRQALDQTVDRFGRLDVLVNNAGLQHVSNIEHFPSDRFEKMIQVMLTASFYAIKHILPVMKKQKFGRIINMSSVNGLIGFPGKAAYNSAKHGLIGLTKVAALETANDGITVNAVCPGYVDTPLVRNQLTDLAKNRGVSLEKVLQEVIYPLVPQKRLLEIDEIVDYVLFLADEKAKGITGQSAVIDGGYTAQ